MSQLETLPTKPDRFKVAKLIEQQIDRVYDRFRMRQAWERVVANIDPAEMAEGMCMALSHGGFTRKQAPPQITLNISATSTRRCWSARLRVRWPVVRRRPCNPTINP